MQEPAEGMRLIRFGAFEANFTTGELRKQGMRLKVQDQPLQVLAMLVARPGELITRDEIRQRLWPSGTFVDFDNGLNTAVNRLREALDDNADTPRFIETLPRRGYRFVAPVQIVEAPARGRKARWLAYAGVAAVATVGVLLGLNVRGWRERLFARATPARISSLAVLPLENLSRDPEQEYFADGMTQELITELSKIGALRVISRTSAMRYKRTTKTVPEIARELNVDAVVEGSVQRSGDRVRITAQLIYAPTDRYVWAESYERSLRDVLALESEVARAIANEIKIKVTPEEQARLGSARPVNPEAHEAYLKGRYQWETKTVEGLNKSVVYFQQAIALEPNYALAYSGLADSYVGLHTDDYLRADESVPKKAKAAALKALEIDDNLGEAHASLGHLLGIYDRNWAGAEREFRRALELSPGYATAHDWYGNYLAQMGRHAEALAEIKRAQQLDPLSNRISANLGKVLYFARQYDQAVEELKKAIEFNPKNQAAHAYLGMVYMQKGMPKEAIAEYMEAGRAGYGAPPEWYISPMLAAAYVMLGEQDRVKKKVQEMEERAKRGFVPPISMGLDYAILGDRQKAFAWLEKAYQQDRAGMNNLKVDPGFDTLRSDPRFQDLLRRMNFPP